MSSLDNVHRLCPEEHGQITKAIVKIGDGFLRYIVQKGVEGPIRDIITINEGFLDRQTSTKEVIKRMQLALDNAELPPEEKKSLPDPGWEGEYPNRDMRVRKMISAREFIGRVCGAFAESLEIPVANVTFIPREYLIDSASLNIDNFLRQYTIPMA